VPEESRNPMPEPLPRTPLKGRAHNGLRWVKRRWRRTFPRPLPPWIGADGVSSVAAPVVLRSADHLEIRGDSVGRVRAALDGADLGIAIRSVQIVVTQWRPPWPGWSGRLGPAAGVIAHTVRLPTGSGGEAIVVVEVATAVAAYRLVDAALAVLDPARPLPASLTADIIVTDGVRPPWLRAGSLVPNWEQAGNPRIPRGRTGSVSDAGRLAGVGPAVPAADLWLGAEPGPAHGDGAAAMTYSRYGVNIATGHSWILVDTAAANPIGRALGGHDLPAAELSLTTEPGGDVWWRIHTRRIDGRRRSSEDSLVVAGRAGDPLDASHRLALARLGTVHHRDSAAACAEHPHASVIVALACTGVAVDAPDLRAATRALLAPELRDIIGRPAPPPDANPIEWDLRSVAQRRAALRGHAADTRLARAEPPTVSAVLVTRRPYYVARVVADLVAQSYPNLEIVVGLHGVELDHDARAQLRSCPIPVEVAEIPAAVSFGAALAMATRAARGSLITKVDDDDRYGPEHVWDLVLARSYSGAAVVGKVAEFVHLAAYDATVQRRMASETYTDVVAGGTILISRGDLDDAGGWRPLARAVDRALLDRVLDSGALVYRTHGFGYVYSRHSEGHTWDPGNRYFLLNPLRHWSGLPPFSEFAGHG
jgi:Glycosyltransferase like family 2